jgi:hypothetical protein
MAVLALLQGAAVLAAMPFGFVRPVALPTMCAPQAIVSCSVAALLWSRSTLESGRLRRVFHQREPCRSEKAP